MTMLNTQTNGFLCDDVAPAAPVAPVAPAAPAAEPTSAVGFMCDDIAPAAPAEKVAQSAPTPAKQAKLARPVVYGDLRSGNCLKIAKLIDYLGLDVEWRDVDLFEGENAEPEFLALNPFGKLPALQLASGQVIAESNAILVELARGTDLEPLDDEARAEIYQWLFWEASAFTPPLAQRRWCVSFVFKAEEDIDPKLMPKGNIVLARLEEHLAVHDYAAGDRLSIADFALYGYGHAIEEGGWRLQDYPAVAAWVARINADLERGVAPWQNPQSFKPSQQIAL